jgi:hypothetical protein
MSPAIDRKLWEKVPPIAVELTERDNKIIQEAMDILGDAFSFLTALKIMELSKKSIEP